MELKFLADHLRYYAHLNWLRSVYINIKRTNYFSLSFGPLLLIFSTLDLLSFLLEIFTQLPNEICTIFQFELVAKRAARHASAFVASIWVFGLFRLLIAYKYDAINSGAVCPSGFPSSNLNLSTRRVASLYFVVDKLS